MSAATGPEQPDNGRESHPTDAGEVERAADTVERVERHSEQSDDAAGVVPQGDPRSSDDDSRPEETP